MNLKSVAVVALFSIVSAGCSTQTFQMNQGNAVNPQKDEYQHFFIGGIGQEKSMNAAEICGGADKVGKVETELTFLNGLLGVITYGIYTPRTARVYCLSK
jgi:hypothetical protein